MGIVLPALIASISGEAQADALYGSYGYQNMGPAALGYPYAYAQGNAAYRVPLRAAAPLPFVHSFPSVRANQLIARPAVQVVPKIAPIVAKPTVQYIPKAAPVPVIATVKATVPLLKAAPAGAVSSQFHAQDELGNYSFGYDNVNSARSESGNSDSVVTGSYVNKAQGTTVNFVSDDLGFRQI